MYSIKGIPVEVGDEWESRDGSIFTIEELDASYGHYPIRGRLKGFRDYDKVSWTATGSYYHGIDESSNDLIKLVTRRKDAMEHLDSRDYFIKIMGGIL